MVGNLSLCLCLWSGWWDICCHCGSCHKPVLGMKLLALTALCLCQLCWGPRDLWAEMLQPCSCILKTAALQRWNTYGICSCSFGLLYNSTLLNWDFTCLLITWEVFLLLGLLRAVLWAVLGSQLCCSQTNGVISLSASLFLWSLRGCSVGEHGSEQGFTGPALSTLEIRVWQLLGVAVIGAWQLELEIVKHYINIFLCASLSQLLQSELHQPGLEASLESSMLQELSWGVTWCICHLLLRSVQELGWKYQASSFPPLLLYKKRGLRWKLLPLFMSLPSYVML